MSDVHVLDCTKLIEREGWNCATCGHRHTGRTLAYVCVGCPCPAKPNDEASERLIAAAPALLAACYRALEDEGQLCGVTRRGDIRAAIAKAEQG